MSYLAYVRHGKSQANLDKIVAGQLDSPLIDVGRQQAQRIANLIRDIEFHYLFSSPLIRAKETIEIIKDQLQLDINPTFHDELKERNWGEIEGVNVDKREEEFPKSLVDSWFTWEGRPPGGESYADMSNRVVSFFDQTLLPLLKADRNLLIVAHNGISKPLQRHFENLPHESTNTLNLDNCEVKLYKFDQTGQVIGVSSRLPNA